MSEPQDKILEVFLEELVSEKRPNFSREILRKLDQQTPANDHAANAEFLTPQILESPLGKPQVQTTQKTADPIPSRGSLMVTMVLAASLMLAATGLIWWLAIPRGDQPLENIANQPVEDQRSPTENPDRINRPRQPSQDLVDNKSNPRPTQLNPRVVVRDDIPKDQTKQIFPGPFQRTTPLVAEVVSAGQAADEINRQLKDVWQSTGSLPADKLGQVAWINRLSNRVIGRTPTAEERQHINELVGDVSDNNELKQQLVNLFINDQRFRDQYDRHWGRVLAWRLLGISTQIGESQVADPDLVRVREHLTTAVADNRPFDEVSYELVSAVGSTDTSRDDFNPAASYLIGLTKRFGKRDLATSHISQAFMGRQTRCAQCHDANQQVAQHQFWEFYSFFAQMRVERAGTGKYIVQNKNFLPFGEQGKSEAPLEFTDRTGQTHQAVPRLEELELDLNGFVAKTDRRSELASFIANSKYWREAMVDHVWASLLNVPLTGINGDPDQALPQLNAIRERLAQQLLANDFQLDWLVRSIVLSDAFAVGAGNDQQIAADNPYLGKSPRFSRFYHRYTSTRAPLQSLAIVAGAYQSGDLAQAFDAGLLARVGDQATQLKTPRLIQPYLPSNDNQWATSQTISRQLDQIATSQMNSKKKIEHLVLIALGRPARNDEIAQGEIILENGTDHRTALQDIWWGLLNSIEYQLPLNAH